VRPENIDKAVKAALQFVDLSRAMKTTKYPSGFIGLTAGPKESGAFRRASMELTRALAEMRKP
jgi:hypothetical protein